MIANLLSLSRLLFAVGFFLNPLRPWMIVLAMISDVLDGYVARNWRQTTRLGTYLDPLTDKIFVLVALSLFYLEDSISLMQILLFLARDISLVAFALWLNYRALKWSVRSFFCGKVMTSLQFVALFLLSLNIIVPDIFFVLMALFGTGSFFELVWRCKHKQVQDLNFK